jgi:molybdate transport system substrate-binding protein
MWTLPRFSAAVLALSLLAVPARAATLSVLSPASAAPGLQAIAAQFTTQTGIAVTVGGGSRGAILNTLKTRGPADVIVLPTTDMTDLNTVQGVVPLGRVMVGVAVKAGDKVPDVSTPEKFRAALLAARGVAYADPATGTSAGKVIDQMLSTPDFKAVKRVPVKGLAVDGLASGQASIALQLLPELTGNKAVAVAGPVPASYGASIDFSAGFAVVSGDSIKAEDFISFLTAPQNVALWRQYGLDPVGH